MSSESAKYRHLEVLLRQLPYAEEPTSDEHIYVSGVLARSEPGLVSIIVAGYCFTLDSADVQDVLQVSAQHENTATPRTVQLLLRRPTRLFSVEPWIELDQAMSGAPRPFAFGARPHPIVAPVHSKYQSLERRFMQDFEK